MADNIEVKDAGGNTKIVRTRDRGSVHTQIMEADGVDPYVNLDVNATGAVVSAAVAQLHNWSIQNLGSVTIYLKFYDKATAPTSGDTPKLVWPIAPITQPVVGGSITGYKFANGIGIRATTGIANGDNTGPGTNELVVNLGHRPG